MRADGRRVEVRFFTGVDGQPLLIDPNSDIAQRTPQYDSSENLIPDANPFGFIIALRVPILNNFRVLVTNANGTPTLETLAKAGWPNSSRWHRDQRRATFTRSNGSTGTADAVSLAYDRADYVVNQTVTANADADGSTTIDIRSGQRRRRHFSAKGKWGNGMSHCRMSKSRPSSRRTR